MAELKELNTRELMKEDVFSQLPRDCHINVFRLLNRKTLDELEVVSKKMGEIVTEPVLRRIKTRGILNLFENGGNSEHGFQYQSGEWDSSRDNYLRFTVGRHTEPEGMRSSVQDEDKLPYGVSRELVTPGAASPVPLPIWKNLAALNKRHAFDHVLLERILINDQFLDDFSPFLTRPNHDVLIFEEVLFDESMDMSKFVEFLFSIKIRYLRLSRGYQALPADTAAFLGMFDEKFLTKFAANCVDETPSFVLGIFSGMFQIPFHWTPSREFLPILNRFDNFSSETMKLRPEHFLELILIRLESARHDVSRWTFSLTTEITNEHMSKLDSTRYTLSEIIHSLYDDDYNDEPTWQKIQKIGTMKMCRFNRYVDANTDEPMVEMEFIDQQIY